MVKIDLPVVVGVLREKVLLRVDDFVRRGEARLFVREVEPLGVTVVAPCFESALLPSLSRKKLHAGKTKAPSSSCCRTVRKSNRDGLISSSWSTPAQSTKYCCMRRSMNQPSQSGPSNSFPSPLSVSLDIVVSFGSWFATPLGVDLVSAMACPKNEEGRTGAYAQTDANTTDRQNQNRQTQAEQTDAIGSNKTQIEVRQGDNNRIETDKRRHRRNEQRTTKITIRSCRRRRIN